jgi:hypothetical protein
VAAKNALDNLKPPLTPRKKRNAVRTNSSPSQAHSPQKLLNDAIISIEQNRLKQQVSAAILQNQQRKERRLNRDSVLPSTKRIKLNDPTESPPQPAPVLSSELPERNSDYINGLIIHAMLTSDLFIVENIDNLLRQNPRRGAVPEDVYISEKWVTYSIVDMFFISVADDKLGFTQEQAHVFVYYLLNDAADEIEDLYRANLTPSTCDDDDENSLYDCFTILHNNKGSPTLNDNLRRYANGIIKDNLPLKSFIANFRYLLDRDKVVRREAFGCGGSGEEDSITLLFALLGCSRQEDHYDYDFNLFKAHRNYDWMTPQDIAIYEDSYKKFNGASMFINMSWTRTQFLDLDNYTTNGEHNKIAMEAMSITIIAGDLKHAGCANGFDSVVRKFFMYLDPCRGCRLEWVSRELVLGEKVSVADNKIFFDSLLYLPKYAHLE